MIGILYSPNRMKNQEIYQIRPNEERCIICGKPVHKATAQYIHVHNGGDVAVTEEEAQSLPSAADLGLQAIGSDCLRKNPQLKFYVVNKI